MANSPYLTDQAVLGASPEVVGLERQRRLADLLTSQAFQSPQGQMISGQYVKPAITQQIQPLLGALLGSTMNKSLDEKQVQLAAALRGKKTEEINKIMSAVKSGDKELAAALAANSETGVGKEFLPSLVENILPKKTPTMIEYEADKTGGFKGSLSDWKNQLTPFQLRELDNKDREFNLQKQKFGLEVSNADKPQLVDTPNGYVWASPKSQNVTPATIGGQQLMGTKGNLPEAATKQVTGATNLKDAINNYKTKLEGFSTVDMANPNARASMGNAYNNMMLQAKEAYNLGVLNGPDYQILQSVVKDPTSAGALLVSKKALNEQATDLAKQADVIISNVYKTHQRQVPTNMQPQGNMQAPSAGQGPRVVDFNSLPTGAR
jgi:hypothetical protein